MDLELSGKRALVTGASKGIGRATARLLATEGCDVLMVSRDASSLEAAAAEIRAGSDRSVDSFAADMSDPASIAALVEGCGRIDILVNNAGAIPPGDLLSLSDQSWRTGWETKVFGYIGLTRALYGRLKTQRGVVVNIIGSAGETPSPGYIAGSTGNAALMMFTRSFARTARADGVRVVGINPGPVATERFEMLIRARAENELGNAERWRELTANMPFGRAAAPEEIAAAVAFLASPRSAYTSGSIMTIDGAMG